MRLLVGFFRSVGLMILGWLFRFSFYICLAAIIGTVLFGNSSLLKRGLTDTNAYARVVPAIIDANNQTTADSIPLDDPKIQAIISEQFSARLLQTEAEKVIDSMYTWLNGGSTYPDFVVDLSAPKNNLITALSDYAVARLEQQPVCTVLPAQINPFTADCKPGQYDPEAQRAAIRSAMEQSKGFLDNPTYSPSSLPKLQNGKAFYEQFDFAPQIFQVLPRVIWGSAILCVACALAIGWYTKPRRLGVYRLAFDITSNGVILFVSPLFFSYILPRFTQSYQLAVSNGGTQAISNDYFQYISASVDNLLFNIGIYMAIVGATVLIFLRTTRPDNNSYRDLAKKSGLATSIATQTGSGKGKAYADSPLQTSEQTGKGQIKAKKRRGYRTIPKKEL